MQKKLIISLTLAAAIIVGFFIYKAKNLSIPKGAKAVDGFEAKKYMGLWYEIARFDYRFEKDMERVTATYSLNPDGTVKVDNKGYDTVEKEWKQSVGVACFINQPDEGRLKVSFFRPFYSAYNILSIDGDYEYALVVGSSPEYLWFLSRKKTFPDSIKAKYLQLAEAVGCDTKELIWVTQ